ncbi:ABC transporter substrate-binding protein [Ammonifex thiophilus]|uniref:ABC transporter substrate-binding protein n=1 Tax=Ammonifex thiophilus TaxID=444093 RepID=A0A3D8P2T5_9THEO|nr:ABC transporter substrate-binding protein [Ammonifex thiophilus]RDV82875.1 ABC transporter substrate-binding protein [Ammonifex thiophilus]
MQRYRWLILAVMVLGLVVVAGCGGKGAAPSAEGPIKIGGIFDLTGATSDVGVPYAEGVRAYIDYVNQHGGINGRKVELKEIDYAYDKNRAVEAYNRLVKQERVIAILGWGTGDTEALKSMIAADKIPYISGSYAESLADIKTCPYNFLVAASYSDQAKAALKWIKDNWKGQGPPKVAFVYNDTPFGRSPIDDAKKFAKEIGIEVVGDEIVGLTALDATPQMLDLKNKGADFAIVQGTSNLAATTLKDAKKLGLKTQFIGLNWAADEKVIKLAGPAAEGYIGVIPFAFPYDNAPGLKTIKEYLASKGQKLEDKNQKFIQGWVSAMIMLEGVKRAGNNLTGEGVRKGLESLKDFDTGGLSAPITFTATSHRGTDRIRLARVENGKFVYITDWISCR